MTEVREGSWAIAQLLAPVHRYEGASRRSLRTFRKSCAHSVSSVKLSEKTGEARQPGTWMGLDGGGGVPIGDLACIPEARSRTGGLDSLCAIPPLRHVSCSGLAGPFLSFDQYGPSTSMF